MSLPASLKRELDDVDQMLEVVQGKLMAISGSAARAGFKDTALLVKRKNGAIGHARRGLREETPRKAAEEAKR